jgi:predicted component of type VI protein secretion system
VAKASAGVEHEAELRQSALIEGELAVDRRHLEGPNGAVVEPQRVRRFGPGMEVQELVAEGGVAYGVVVEAHDLQGHVLLKRVTHGHRYAIAVGELRIELKGPGVDRHLAVARCGVRLLLHRVDELVRAG